MLTTPRWKGVHVLTALVCLCACDAVHVGRTLGALSRRSGRAQEAMLVSGAPYKVERGDTIGTLTDRFGLPSGHWKRSDVRAGATVSCSVRDAVVCAGTRHLAHATLCPIVAAIARPLLAAHGHQRAERAGCGA